jgi:hypothetical protein
MPALSEGGRVSSAGQSSCMRKLISCIHFVSLIIYSAKDRKPDSEKIGVPRLSSWHVGADT